MENDYMILTVAVYAAGLILGFITSIFDVVGIVIPDEVEEAVIWAFGNLRYFQGIFPIDTFFSAVAFVIQVWIAIYALKMFRFLWAMIPIVGVISRIQSIHFGRRR